MKHCLGKGLGLEEVLAMSQSYFGTGMQWKQFCGCQAKLESCCIDF